MAGSIVDVIVIGAGPAGLMAGIAAGRRGLSVLILEKMDRPCRKLRITGKGRCNVANACDDVAFFEHIRSGARFLRSSVAAFGARDIMRFFEDNGVPLKVERGHRVFPRSDRAQDIADALVRAAKEAGCLLEQGRVTGLVIEGGAVRGVQIAGAPDRRCRAVVVATGGQSFPKTGSSGDGYRLAASVGHAVTPPVPSLVALTCAGTDCARMQGLTLRNVTLAARRAKKLLFEEQGELLFTHFGISGPLALSLSATLVGEDPAQIEAWLNLKPALDEAALDRRILRDFAQNSNRAFKNSLDALLPRTMIGVVVERCGVDPEKKVHAVTVGERSALLRTLRHFDLTLTGTRPIEEAVVTAGGVALREVDPKTMQSKRVKQLHFAGEVLDADGVTGGFNLGIAFATGYAAGCHILEETT